MTARLQKAVLLLPSKQQTFEGNISLRLGHKLKLGVGSFGTFLTYGKFMSCLGRFVLNTHIKLKFAKGIARF